jgi:serine/threonine protein kinase
MPSNGRDDPPPFEFDTAGSKPHSDQQSTGGESAGPPVENETVSWDGKGANRRGERFTIVRPHGRGGLGVVYVAHDHELDRDVALKEIRDKHADDPHARERFIREAQITAKLGHPNICPVHSLGTDDKGRPYYAMSLVLGRTLQDANAEFHNSDKSRSADLLHSVEFRALLQSLIDVCGAVAYAHSRAVLHRDLKPSNIMLGPYGETMLLDWGLAKSVTPNSPASLDAEPPIRLTGSHDSQQTLPGEAVGTPSYMSPEQAGGRSDRVGPTTDVYGLGATLYAILTGAAPVKESTKEQTLARVASGKFQPPRVVNPRIPKSLESICLRAMSREPDQRYHTPKELAQDLERWLADEPVSSHIDSAWEAARRWARRNRAAVASAGILLALSSVGLGVSNYRVSKERDRANAATIKAQASSKIALRNSNIAKAALANAERSRDGARDALAQSKQSEAKALKAAELSLSTIREALIKIGDDKVAQIPGSAQIRFDMANLASQKIRELIQSFPDVIPIDRSLADSLWRCGNIYKNIDRSQVGDTKFSGFEESRRAYRESIAIIDRLKPQTPNDPALADLSLRVRAADLDGSLQANGAMAAQAEADDLLKEIEETKRRFPDNVPLTFAGAYNGLSVANVFNRVGKKEEAMRLMKRFSGILSQIADSNGKNAPLAYAALQGLIFLSHTAHDSGDHELGDSAIADAEARAALLQSTNKNQTSENLEIMVFETKLQWAIERGDFEKAASISNTLVPRIESFVKDGADYTSRRRRLAETHFRQSLLYLGQEKYAEGLEEAKASLAILEPLAKENPFAFIYKSWIARSLAAQALNSEKLGDATAAEVKELAVKQLVEVQKSEPGNEEYTRLLKRLTI